MGRIFAFGLLGALLGFLFPSLGFSDRPPLPPALWTTGPLIGYAKKVQQEGELAARLAEQPENPFLHARKNGYEALLKEAREAARFYYSPPRALFGEIEPLGGMKAKARRAVRIGCWQGDEDHCCTQFLSRSEDGTHWIDEQAQQGIPTDAYVGRGYLNHYTYEPPYRQGLPFLFQVHELPLREERETKVWAFGPDDNRWKPIARISWRPEENVPRCQW